MKNFILITLTFIMSHLTTAQSIVCSGFSVTNFQTDTISIYFAADPSYMVSYPLITAVTNCDGDTIAQQSGISFFGHPGQTTLQYEIDITGQTCLPMIIHLNYNTETSNETCLLAYNSPITTVNEIEHEKQSVYPNPSTSMVKINLPLSEGLPYTIFTGSGVQVTSGKVKNSEIDITHLSRGFYYIIVGGKTIIIVKD
jgi:hypothetical protein